VVGDVRQAGLAQPPLAELHMPYHHPALGRFLQNADVTLVLKTQVAPVSVAPALRDAVQAVDADQPLYEILTMEEVIERSVAGPRLQLVLMGTFAGIALLLAIVGLYGVISYLVAQRTREMGIRMALGAGPADVVWLVMRQGARLAAVGIGLGLAGAYGLSQLLESQLYGVSAQDPLTFGALAALLGSVALVATFLPARRAARVDPLIAMKGE
jgi:ABC-type antimicrobial peptide transport system permease subunit